MNNGLLLHITFNKKHLPSIRQNLVKYSFLLIKKATVSQTTIGIRSLFHIFAPAFLIFE